MRPQLFWGGLLVLLAGAGLWLILLLDIGIPLAIGGAIMLIASFLLPPGPGPVTPSPGFRFCVFCSTPVPLGSDRCPHCNGVQPKEP
jgi:hypothetical protein